MGPKFDSVSLGFPHQRQWSKLVDCTGTYHNITYQNITYHSITYHNTTYHSITCENVTMWHPPHLLSLWCETMVAPVPFGPIQYTSYSWKGYFTCLTCCHPTIIFKGQILGQISDFLLRILGAIQYIWYSLIFMEGQLYLSFKGITLSSQFEINILVLGNIPPMWKSEKPATLKVIWRPVKF